MHHLTVNSIVRSRAICISRNWRSLHVPFWFLKYVCKIRRNGVVILDHLLDDQEVLHRAFVLRALRCSTSKLLE